MKREIIKSLIASLWFMALTFPLMVVRVNTIENTVEWRWANMAIVGVSIFFGSFVWRYLMDKRLKGEKAEEEGVERKATPIQKFMDDPKKMKTLAAVVLISSLILPLVSDDYQVNILITAMIYVMLGLGLNIVVGLAGLLDLGYVAFYAVGAYAYALLNYHFGLSFWVALPLGALLGAGFGILLGIPVLRLRGDYLAIVTLGFGEIVRLILENWNEFSFGPSGIDQIPPPGIPGVELSFSQNLVFIYYIVIVLVLFTIFVVERLRNSRLGRSWLALREDEIACQAMGVDKMKTKLAAFALGATWAGMAGVVFAAKTSFINPASFTFLESAIILSIVVLGGMGSISGVVLAALLLVLLPEGLRAFSEYRMIIFGAAMVLMMVFRPQGLVSVKRRSYEYHGLDEARDG